MSVQHIVLRGVEVHNLKKIDLDIPHRKLVVFCGVSGSGKTSLALDTLYAEGQRRYIESFSAYTRQFLERLDKPAADRIDGIPPSIAVTHKSPTRSNRSTVGTATETHEYLRLLFSRIGKVYCSGCGRPIHRDMPDTAAELLQNLPDQQRFIIAFRPAIGADETPLNVVQAMLADGFVRGIYNSQTWNLSDLISQWEAAPQPPRSSQKDWQLRIVVDRLKGSSPPERIRDSLEIAFRNGEGRCFAYVEDCQQSNPSSRLDSQPSGQSDSPANPRLLTSAQSAAATAGASAQQRLAHGEPLVLDHRSFRRIRFNTELVCETCDISYNRIEPQLFSFNSPLGACPTCEGFGNLIDLDMDLIVPDPAKSLRDGAIAPWNTPAYEHELHELLALADDYGIPVDVPFEQLATEQLQLIRQGIPERKFGGLDGFFAWLERRKYKMHLRVFLSRWRSARPCPDCHGQRLRPEALAVRIGGQNIAQIAKMRIADAVEYFASLKLSDHQRAVGRMMLEQVQSRLEYLVNVGVGYLTLDRPLRTLSGGEVQRVALTSALGSSLVNMLYVLDEPSVGLHPRDTDQLFAAVEKLRDRGNSVIVVEHEEQFLRDADHVIEIGPGAGESGGQIVFEGTPEAMLADGASLTGEYLMGRRGQSGPPNRRKPTHGWVRVKDARGNNLKNITAEFPLGVLCVVTGVSGAGKSTLVQDTLFPALSRRKRKEAPKPLPFGDVFGDGQIDDLTLIDQSPIGKSPRSNPVTYIKAFDAIRAVFADTLEARTHNYSAGHFSFNVDGGRCTACQGDGYVQIDMQFLADVYMKCAQCQGKRYRREILEITYRGKNVAEVLDMSVRKAFSFFRGQEKVQKRLKRLMDVGLDYVRLGQPANTLSAGEAQRLKLAGYLASAKRHRTLFLLDEPTTGLHFSDIVKLLDCFDALLADGHSLIVVEHNIQMMKAADYIVDLGPGAADEGGEVVAAGTPEDIADNADSITGRYLAAALSDRYDNQPA